MRKDGWVKTEGEVRTGDGSERMAGEWVMMGM